MPLLCEASVCASGMLDSSNCIAEEDSGSVVSVFGSAGLLTLVVSFTGVGSRAGSMAGASGGASKGDADAAFL